MKDGHMVILAREFGGGNSVTCSASKGAPSLSKGHYCGHSSFTGPPAAATATGYEAH